MRERRPGVWELIVQLPRDESAITARQISRTVRGTKREAQRALAALVTEVSAGKVDRCATGAPPHQRSEAEGPRLLRRWRPMKAWTFLTTPLSFTPQGVTAKADRTRRTRRYVVILSGSQWYSTDNRP